MHSLLLFGLPLAAVAQQWPDFRTEQADNLLWGDSSPLTFAIIPRADTTVAAQWIRLAYHDMSTHNVDDGSGGLDGSIVYELDRAQNIGQGMFDSARELASLATTPHISYPDAIALGAIHGVSAFKGPYIPFRAGRIGATAAGPPTVPEPHQTLGEHMESFRRQGFTQSEMIALVACGHTLGGVRRGDFPTIIPPAQGPGRNQDFVTFDRTSGFDNGVVTEYLQNTTQNPLVVGHNATTNSDMRIFSSDKNATMQSISSPNAFSSICAHLFERMLNTVPAGVKLSDVIDPVKYKVGNTNLIPGTIAEELRFITSLRLLQPKANREVTLFWKNGDKTSSASPGQVRIKGTGSAPARNIGLNAFTWFDFDVKLSAPISKFWFTVNEGDGSPTVTVDNGGEGLALNQNNLLFDVSRTAKNAGGSADVVLAVKTTDSSAKVTIDVFIPGGIDDVSQVKNPHGTWKTVQASVDTRYQSISGYTFFSTTIDGNPADDMWFNAAAEVGGKRFELRDRQVMTLPRI